MLTIFNYSKMRCKKMHWMTENTIWEWFCTFIDCNNQLIPKNAVGAPIFKKLCGLLTSAKGHWTRAQGPPKT